MKYRRILFSTENAYSQDTDKIFVKAMKENCEYQYRHCAEYRKILDGMKFSPNDIKSVKDLEKLPFIPTLLFKKHKLYSVPPSRTAIRATSSGTTGIKSEIGFCIGDLYAGLKMVIRVSKLRGLFSPVPCHYIVFGYKPHRNNKTAVTKTALGATLFTPAFSRTFALTYQNGKYSLNLENILQAVIKHSHSRFPVRFMGFPSYTYFLMKMMDERNIHVKLPKNSKILLGGGWKQFYTEQVDKDIFYELAKKVLDIDDSNIIEFFGAVEHPVLYCDCKNHHFHIPVYSRVLIRDADTLEVLGNEKEVLVNLMTPMLKACPILSVMTDDLGILHDGKQCGCGIESPYLEIIGRIGMKDIKTCAAGAAELLKEMKI